MSSMRLGLRRGWIDIRHTFTSPAELWQYVFPAILLLGTAFFMRNATVPGTSFSLGARTLPSAFGMGIAMGGLVATAQMLIVDREDGTLLRAKAVPRGMTSYLIGKVVTIGGMSLISFLLQLIPGLLLVKGLDAGGTDWLTLFWLLPLGFVATLPLGAAIGSLFDDPRNMAMVMFPILGLIAISGIFYPISGFPGWLQGVAQAFPMYWLGLGMRSAFLPDSMASVEIAHSWRHLATFGVLTGWAIIGLTLAPMLLRRMAARESGSAVAARRERALTRVGR
ncbi:ABC transporter permease [Actinoplanes regularis]|uniref:ABC-2 type transport system permease protein n=1 Tax=Actinoplanes regularis TaxID=52697 RepID=A0A238V4J5_9ACTN|nr:ABC transporter permease [Actinoplanes regularis]GIE84037.1 transport permease protein [Actinoplanes regularis]GLW28931.1 transport permease protein [Actinoplanes regularis]SNR28439.1 ABC-2 type transport system permease protein [Actinoplanes regularis]